MLFQHPKVDEFLPPSKAVQKALQTILKGVLLVTCQKHAPNLLRTCFQPVRNLLLTGYYQTGNTRPFKQAQKRAKKDSNQLPIHDYLQQGNEPTGNPGIHCNRYRVYRRRDK